MDRSPAAADTLARSRRRVLVLACEDRPTYHVAADPTITDHAPAGHVDEPRREDAVVAWAGPSVPSVAQLDGWYDRPPTGPVPHAARTRELVDRDGLVELDEPGPFPGQHSDGEPTGTAHEGHDQGPGIRDRVRGLQQDARRLLGEVSGAPAASGELGALVDLAGVADTLHAVMVTLTAQVEDGMIAHRRAGLPLVEVLAIATRMTKTERRQLLRSAATRDRLPALDAAVHAGLVGAAEARAALASCRGLDADGRVARSMDCSSLTGSWRPDGRCGPRRDRRAGRAHR